MKVFYFSPENSGVGMYRFWQPLTDLQERGKIELKSWGFDFTGKHFELPTIKELKEIADWGDIFIFGRLDIPQYLNVIQTIKEFSKKPVLLDIDDNIYSISPYMAANVAYNVNGDAIKTHEEVVKYVDGIIVSTPFLEDFYKKKNKVWVIPNGVKHLYEKRKHDGVNIGYLASSSHLENSKIIEFAVTRVLQKYSNVNFYYTRSFAGFMERIPKEIESQVHYLPFYPLKDYLSYVNHMGIDVGLAPLMKNDFNKAKSNIRVLEYWQNGIVPIASQQYSTTITPGFDGYISEDDEWEYWIDDLVKNPERREYMRRNSRETLRKYDVSLFADKYYEVLRESIDGKEN